MAALLALSMLLQAKYPLADHWSKLRDAWTAARDAGGDEDYVADKVLEAAAKLHAAFEAAGLNAKELPADRAALSGESKELAIRAKSLIKDLAPEMGRNFKLLYNVKF